MRPKNSGCRTGGQPSFPFSEKKTGNAGEHLQVLDVDKAHQEIQAILSKLGGVIRQRQTRGAHTLTIQLEPSKERLS